MKQYVLAFIFNKDLDSVWLIKKNKPEWQKGCLNGIGGKIERGERPIDAMERELREETGIRLPGVDPLMSVGRMQGINNDGEDFQVFIYASVVDDRLESKETEEVSLYKLEDVKKHRVIGNVPMLIEACLYRISQSSHFNYMVMEYYGGTL